MNPPANTLSTPAPDAPVLAVDIYSDLICPWCHIGRARLGRALAQANLTARTHVRWLPFQLNPDMPVTGLERRAYRTRKFGSWARSQELDRGVVEAGRAESLEFNYDRVLVTPNTFAGHRLLWWAAHTAGDRQDALASALFHAYFGAGRDIGHAEVLADIAGETGLPRAEAAGFLASDAGRTEVLAEEKTGRARGLSGVPCFLINGQPAGTGAQEPAAFAHALRLGVERAFGHCQDGACGL
jgi:predicted DsbA family dithiol-disulfide isomerase